MSDDIETPDAPPPHQPHIRVLKGKPTDDEVAALIAVLGSAGGHPLGATRRQTSVLQLQLADDHPVGTESHAPMTMQSAAMLRNGAIQARR